jgi:3-oxoacyl-[acyl-carrier-protein] synthase III
MSFPEVYLSRPAVVLPEQRLSNDEVLRRIREAYRGSAEDWTIIEAGVRTVFARCNSQYRHIEADQTLRVGDFAAEAARSCLESNGVAPSDVDMVIYGGIAREYFEPATAMEVAAKAGIETVHAFDVTSACVGQLEGVQIACAYLALHPHINTVLVASAELTRGFLSYDIQEPSELVHKLAGLTIGNAAAAFLVRRTPFDGGCIRLLAASNFSRPGHWGLCQAPIDGSFTSYSHELFKLNVYIPDVVNALLAGLGWTVPDVDHFVVHQPSDHIVVKVLTDMGAEPDRAVRTHHLYGNTASTTVALALNHLLETLPVRGGEKMVLTSAAAGFSLVTMAGVWTD